MIDRDEARREADELRDIVAAMASHEARLLDRAAIPTGATGFPPRASGAQPAITPGHTMWTTANSWECACGRHGPPDMSAEAVITAMDDHHAETHRWIDYADPTGDQAGRAPGRDPVAADCRQFERLKREMLDRARIAYEILTRNGLIGRSAPEASCPEGWCRSCWRDGKYHEPVPVDGNGHPYYADLCRWCGEWVAAHPRKNLKRGDSRLWPPFALIEARHRGLRITQAMVDDATGKKRRAAV